MDEAFKIDRVVSAIDVGADEGEDLEEQEDVVEGGVDVPHERLNLREVDQLEEEHYDDL